MDGAQSPVMPPPEQWAALAPDSSSVTYRRADDVRVMLAAGYALLLQVAHPTVGAGVSEHSRFRSDPWGRLLRTLDYSCTMVYAGPEAAGEMGLRLRAYHRRITGVADDGTRYHALEPQAYAWVHATLAAGIVRAHECFIAPLSAQECEQLWQEWRALGRLLGVRERDLPPDWQGFCSYFEEMIDGGLRHTAAVEEVLQALRRPAAPELPAPLRALWPPAGRWLGRVFLLATHGLLAPALRERFGVSWGRRQELELAALSASMRAATPVMPAALRNSGPGYLRWRADALARGEAASVR